MNQWEKIYWSNRKDILLCGERLFLYGERSPPHIKMLRRLIFFSQLSLGDGQGHASPVLQVHR